MFPFVSFRANGGATFNTEDPGAEFLSSGPGCQFRYSRKAPASTTRSANISGTVPIPLRGNALLFIPRPPDCYPSNLDAHDIKSDARAYRSRGSRNPPSASPGKGARSPIARRDIMALRGDSV